jgi:hypothetical protein
MRTRSKLILAALTATILLGLAVSTATARNIEVLNAEKGFRVTWSALEFSNNVGLETVRCPVTIEGTFHQRTFTKTARTLIGYVTRAIVNGTEPPCSGGRARVFTESLPWHVQYASFEGTLPNIAALNLRLVGARFAVEPKGSGLICNSRTSEASPALGRFITAAEAGGLRQITGATPSGSIPLEGGGLCGLGTGEFRSVNPGTVTVLGETATIKVKLIA